MMVVFGLMRLLSGVAAALGTWFLTVVGLLTGVVALFGITLWRMVALALLGRTLHSPLGVKRAGNDWPPKVGGEVEMWSRFADHWFPAIIVDCSESPTEEWPLLVVRLKGNGAVDEKVQESEIRPLRRLAAARREHPDSAYGAYDNDNIRHLRNCGGCPECKGLGAYYYECKLPCSNCMHHHTETCLYRH